MTASRTELRIATRGSPLALWQAEHVQARLEALHPELKVSLLTMKTRGDKLLDAPLAKVGGKGLFVKELEAGLLDGSADLAVHSLKDVPVHFPDGLELALVMEREDPRDAFVSNSYDSLDAMPAGSLVGTSSLRRQTQVRERYPDLEVDWLRGNVNTRLAKLDAGDYDAIILAASGLKRLGFDDRIRAEIPPEECLPAIGQGVLGIEIRSDDALTTRSCANGSHRWRMPKPRCGLPPSARSIKPSTGAARCRSRATPCLSRARFTCVAWLANPTAARYCAPRYAAAASVRMSSASSWRSS